MQLHWSMKSCPHNLRIMSKWSSHNLRIWTKFLKFDWLVTGRHGWSHKPILSIWQTWVKNDWALFFCGVKSSAISLSCEHAWTPCGFTLKAASALSCLAKPFALSMIPSVRCSRVTSCLSNINSYRLWSRASCSGVCCSKRFNPSPLTTSWIPSNHNLNIKPSRILIGLITARG